MVEAESLCNCEGKVKCKRPFFSLLLDITGALKQSYFCSLELLEAELFLFS